MEIKAYPNTLVKYLAMLKESGIPENEFQKHIGNFFEFSSREKGIPLHGTFELTPICNLDCKMCYVHLNNSQFDYKQLLDFSFWKFIIDEAYECGMRKATLTGGECLTFPWFNDVFLHLYNKGVRTNVLTNGILLNEERISFFKKYRPKSIQVTLYGSNEDAYEKVTGHRVFNIVKKNLQLAHEADLPISIAITPSRFMLGDLDQTLELADSLCISYSVNAFLSTPRENTGRLNEDLTVEQYIKVYKKRNELRHDDEAPMIPLSELPDPSTSSNPTYGIKCGAGRSSFLIKYDGEMSPCLSLYEISSNPLSLGFRQAWREINQKANSYKRPEECGDCYYSSVCLKCVAIHKNAPLKGHCDPRICMRTRKMVAAGILPTPEKLEEPKK